MTQESILDTLATFDWLLVAHEAFEVLTADEFPEGRKVYLLKEAHGEILAMPRSPGDEDPDVSSSQQLLNLVRRFIMNGRMRHGHDHQAANRTDGIWKWKTRTVRITGAYFGGPNCFVIAHVKFARDLKRHGKPVKALEAAFTNEAARRLRCLGILQYAWKNEDPHHDQTQTFDPY